MKKNIVVSAINFYEGGPLTVFKDCLSVLSKELSDQYNVIALVSSKKLFNIDNISFYEFPNARKSWFIRIYNEYVYFRFLSGFLKPYLWLSLHDMTPNVKAKILAVYCHNPAPFYKLSFNDLLMDPKFALFTMIYKYAYQINIKKADFIVVQQNWLRDKFKSMFNINNIIVSFPDVAAPKITPVENSGSVNKNKSFFYPTFPRCFKNIEIVCEAAKILTGQGVCNFEVYLTINGRENRYAKQLYNKYKSIEQIKFVGILSREKVYEYYEMVNCLIFPSKLETWGLPITEFKSFNKPILLADLEYAHETIGVYDKVRLFSPNNPIQLAGFMRDVIENKIAYNPLIRKVAFPPFASNWSELFSLLLAGEAKA